MLRIKGINELPSEEDGFRILIDELWPEGLSKEEAKVDLWLQEITTPPPFDQPPEEDSTYFEKVETEYSDNFQKKKNLIKMIRDTEKEKGTVTFLYSTIKSINELKF